MIPQEICVHCKREPQDCSGCDCCMFCCRCGNWYSEENEEERKMTKNWMARMFLAAPFHYSRTEAEFPGRAARASSGQLIFKLSAR